MAYPTLDEMKSYLKIDTGTTSDDTILTEFIATAKAIIESPPPLGTGRIFEMAASTIRYFDAIQNVSGRDLLFFEDVCQIDSVVNGDGSTIAPSGYITMPARTGPPWYGITLKVATDSIWTYSDSPEAAIAVTGRWSYSIEANNVVKQLTYRLVQWLYRQKSGTANDQAIQTDSGLILPATLPKDIQATIQSFWSLV